MVTTLDHDLRISGALRAGNIAHGSVTINPTPGSATSFAVTGVNLAGTGAVYGLCTAESAVPGTTVVETSVSSATPTGMTVWLNRTNSTATNVHWMMVRSRT